MTRIMPADTNSEGLNGKQSSFKLNLSFRNGSKKKSIVKKMRNPAHVK